MEEGIRNERFSSGARASGVRRRRRRGTVLHGDEVHRAGCDDRDGFPGGQRAVVACADLLLLLYLAACGQRSTAFKMLVFYAALWGRVPGACIRKMTVIVFSPVHFYAAIKTYPIMVAFFAVALSPPGLSAPRWRRLAFRSA